MAKNIFEENAEDRVKPLLGEKTITSMVERAGYIVAGAILLVVILVMTTDIKFITAQSVADFSVAFFVLMFCSCAMYANMYKNGMIAGERLQAYKDICAEYDSVRESIKSANVNKKLADFCRSYVDNELRSRIEEVLSFADISYESFSRYRHMSIPEMREAGLYKLQINRIRAARRIRPIKLSPSMLYKQGARASRRKTLHTPPAERRRMDNAFKFMTTAFSYSVTGFIAFEIFTDPSWQTFCAVAFKLLMVGYTGYSGYMRGYDNIATDTVFYIRDQIDLLKQFKSWEARENDEQQSTSECPNSQ